MAQVKFYRGAEALYTANTAKYADGIYFATDKKLIYMDGAAYGFNAANLAAVKDVKVKAGTGNEHILEITYVDGTTTATTINLNTQIKVDGATVVKDGSTGALKSGVTLKSIAAVGDNAASYQLQDAAGNAIGDTINIAKDQHLKSVDLVKLAAAIDGVGAKDDDVLKFVWYVTEDGATAEKTTYVNVASFLRESEKGDGLQVVNGILSVKKDATSESFLSVGADGVKLTGVQDAADTAESNAKTYAEGLLAWNEATA